MYTQQISQPVEFRQKHSCKSNYFLFLCLLSSCVSHAFIMTIPQSWEIEMFLAILILTAFDYYEAKNVMDEGKYLFYSQNNNFNECKMFSCSLWCVN